MISSENESFFNYRELKIDRSGSEFHIDSSNDFKNDLNILIQNLKNMLVRKYSNKNIENEASNENDLDFCIKYKNTETNLKYLAEITSNNDDINKNNDDSNIYDKLNSEYTNLLPKINQNSIIPKDLYPKIDEISRKVMLAINIFNVLQVCHFKIITFFVNFIKLINEFFSTEKNSEKRTFSLHSCLINQNKKPIIVFTQQPSSDNNTKFQKDEIKNFLIFILQQYKKITVFSEGNDETDLQKYFNYKVLTFINETTALVHTKFTQISTFLESIQKVEQQFNNVKTFSSKTVSNLTYDGSGTDCLWSLLLNTNYSSIYAWVIKKILNFYLSYVEISPKMNIFDKFIKFYNDHNPDRSVSNVGPTSIDRIIKEIQKTGEYFYFSCLFQIVMKNLINQSYYLTQIVSFFPVSSPYDDKKEIEYEYQMFNSNSILITDSFTTLSYFDKEFNLFSMINYFSKSERKREIDIFRNKYSKFIIHSDISFSNDNKIMIPFFPCKRLYDSIVRPNNYSKSGIKLSFIDKIVIILEVATALNDLHVNNEYHGNLSTLSLLMNSKKDVYLGGFSYDPLKQKNNTITKNTNYYISPEMKKEFMKQKNNDSIEFSMSIEKLQKSDIYSFGVLMFAVITGCEPESKFTGKNKHLTKSERAELDQKGTFFDFLLTDNESFFDNSSIDERGNSMVGFKEIIQKCMSLNLNDRYSNFNEVINSIKETVIYEKNKPEIEFRLENADTSSEYKCTLSDLVEGYYLGAENCLDDIRGLLSYYRIHKSGNYDKIVIKNDLIQTIFEIFELKQSDSITDIFEDLFNSIIQIHFKKLIDSNISIDLRNDLYIFSIDYALKKNNANYFIDFIAPFTTLDDFLTNNSNSIEKVALNWIFFISKEIALFHSYNLFHGELGLDTIGIYFDDETKSFYPSIILFYSFFKRTINSRPKMPSKRKTNEWSTDQIISFFQMKDLKKFIEIVKQFNVTSDELIEKLNEAYSMNEIVMILYQYICSQNNEILEQSYSINQITYSSLKFVLSIINQNQFVFKKPIFNIEYVLKLINGFLEKSIAEPMNSIIDNINSGMIDLNNGDNNVNANVLFEKVKLNCANIWSSIFDQISIKAVKNDESKNDDFSFNFMTCEMKRNNQKRYFENPIQRKLEISDLCIRSVEFLVQRYIFNLNPNYKFKLIIKIVNKPFSHNQDIQIKADDIIYIANELGYDDIKIKNGDVIIYISPSQS